MTETLNYKQLDSCLCCGGKNISNILDLKEQPLANSYLKSIDESEDYYPLGVNYCNDCTHLQLTHAVNPDLLFKNYLYVSGTTKTLRDYFDNFVDITLDYFDKKSNLNVLDIACNDGSQLDSYKKRNFNTYGVDPAENLYELSSKNHNIVCDYFTEDSVSKLSSSEFDIIVAQNVFAHNTYPNYFLTVCKEHLSETGKIFIQTSQADMVKYGQFDTIYHEHISFFNVTSMAALVKQSGLYLQDVLKTSIHGTSYVFVLSKNPTDDNATQLIENDFAHDRMAIDNFAHMAKSVVVNLKNELDKHRDSVIIGYGAAAKGNTLLNFGEIDLDYIVDDNPLKQKLFTPGRKIKIISIDDVNNLVGSKSIVWVPLSWNFFDEIKNRVKAKRYETSTFIKYFPKLRTIIE